MDEAKAAILILRALIEQLVESDVLSKNAAVQIVNRAKLISHAEYPTRESKPREERILDDFGKKLAK